MIKDISTYGILLMTTLVVYRASTLEVEDQLSTENSIHQASVSVVKNWSSSPKYKHEHVLLAKIDNNTKMEEKRLDQSNSVQNIALVEPTYEPSHTPVEEDQYVENQLIEVEEAFSLDRESTISSNLSLLFPRQRILQRPSNNDFEE